MDKKQKRITAVAIIIISLVIIVILILTMTGSGGISIQDIKNNPEKYLDKTITLTASYSGASNGYLIQEDFFGNTEGIKVEIGEDVDISMLLHGREYHWTGTVVQITDNDNTYLRFVVQEIETLYEDDGRHDTSKLIGTWKLIESSEDYGINKIWIFYENNSLKISSSPDWGSYMVDADKMYFNPFTPFTDPYAMSYTYYFTENDTKLTIDENAERDLIRVYVRQ